MIEYIIIGGGILFGLIGFLIGTYLVMRSYRESPSIGHYKRIIDILTLRKLRKKGDIGAPNTYTDNTGDDHIKHYEKMRDKLTTRTKSKKEEGFSLPIPLGTLIGGFITILIGVTLLPEIAKQVGVAQSNMNVTGTESASAVLSMIPLFFGLAIVGVVIAVVAGALRSTGTV
jgi:hypothetical protein